MNQTETHPNYGPLWIRRSAAVCLMLTAVVLAAGVMTAGDDVHATEAEQTLYLIPGFDNHFQIEGTLESAEATVIAVCTDNLGNPIKITGDNKITSADGKYTYNFSINTGDASITSSTFFRLKINLVDKTETISTERYTLKPLSPDFTEPTGESHVIKGDSAKIGVTIEPIPAAKDLPSEYSLSYLLKWNGGESTVAYSEGKFTVPNEIPLGKNTCTLLMKITDSVELSSREKTFESETFIINVQEKPTFTLNPASYSMNVGQKLTVSLDLTGAETSGTWDVSKSGVSKAQIPYTGSPVSFSIDSLEKDDAGSYAVKFVTDSDISSETSSFDLAVYEDKGSALVTLTGLGPGNTLEANEKSLKTSLCVESEATLVLKVTNSAGEDVSDRFKIVKGRLCLNSAIPAGNYTLRFVDESTKSFAEQEVTLKYVAPPTIDSIRPISGFTVG